MRPVPVTAVLAAVVLFPLGMLATRELGTAQRAQADARVVTVAKRYAALTGVVMQGPSTAAPRVGTPAEGPTLDATRRAALQGVIATAAVSEIGVELVDGTGYVIAGTKDPASAPEREYAAATLAAGEAVFSLKVGDVVERAAAVPANGGAWRVLAHQPVERAYAVFYQFRAGLFTAVAILYLVVVAGAVIVDRLMNRRIRAPAIQLADLAEAVAAGDLTVRVPSISSTDEVERLARALAVMVSELSRLAQAMNAAARETSAKSGEITASTEEMAASAGQMAQTAGSLSAESASMVDAIRSLTSSANELVSLAGQLDSGAHEGVERNVRLRILALENRGRLDDGSRALDTLTLEVESGADAITALAAASQEIRSFVTLVQKLARQSKLLALNASMEAARAGEYGAGFGVVANEVRRLSTMSAEAADRTERVVSQILAGVESSRDSAQRTVTTAREVREVTSQGSQSFGLIEGAVAELEHWTASIEHTATGTNALVKRMTERLETLSHGTETLAAAMEEVAASSEQQSASTEEIAAAATALDGAAERLSKLVANLRTKDSKGITLG